MTEEKKEDIDINRWIPAATLNREDYSGLFTDVLIVSIRLPGQEQAIMESFDSRLRENRLFTCLVRTYKIPEQIHPGDSQYATIEVSIAGPVDIPLGNLVGWGVLPETTLGKRES